MNFEGRDRSAVWAMWAVARMYAEFTGRADPSAVADEWIEYAEQTFAGQGMDSAQHEQMFAWIRERVSRPDTP